MSVVLLVTTLLLALAISGATWRFFRAPLDAVLTRIVAGDVRNAWLTYLKFSILVVGVSAGVRIRELERHAMALRSDKESAGILDFTWERWVLELYRTAIDTLQGIAWMLLVFFVFALIAYVIVRITELRFGVESKPPRRDDAA